MVSLSSPIGKWTVPLVSLSYLIRADGAREISMVISSASPDRHPLQTPDPQETESDLLVTPRIYLSRSFAANREPTSSTRLNRITEAFNIVLPPTSTISRLRILPLNGRLRDRAWTLPRHTSVAIFGWMQRRVEQAQRRMRQSVHGVQLKRRKSKLPKFPRRKRSRSPLLQLLRLQAKRRLLP